MKTIFIDCNDQLGAVWKMVYRADDPPVTINTAPFERDDLPKLVGDYEVVIDDHSYMPTNLVKQCKNLKHIVFLGTGAASYMNVAELEKIGVKVHTIKGYGDTAVAEQTIALMFAAARDLARMDRNIRGGIWRPREGVQLKDKTLGIIGLGGIGLEVARIAKGIGMDVIAWNRTPRPEAPRAAGRSRHAADEVRCRFDQPHPERRNPRLPRRQENRPHETWRYPRQHRARRTGRRACAVRCIAHGTHPPRRL